MNKGHDAMRTPSLRRYLLGVVLPIALLSGCASAPATKQAQQVDREATRLAEQARQGVPPKSEVWHEHADQWVDLQPVVRDQRQTLPQLHCDITFDPHVPVNVDMFGSIVTRQCGVPVRITADARQKLEGRAGGSVGGGNGAVAPKPAGGGMSLPPLPGMPLAGGTGGGESTLLFHYRGPLSGLMDRGSMQLGLSWRVDHGTLVLFYTESRVFTLPVLPGKTTLDSKVNSGVSTQVGIAAGGGGSGGGGGSSGGGVGGQSGTTQTTSVSMTTDIRDDLEKAVQSMLTPGVGRMAYATSTGTIVVTDTPEVLDTVGQFVSDQSTILTKQVVLNVRVLYVQLSKKDQLGINWSMAYNAVNGRSSATLTNLTQADQSASGFSIGILKGPFAGTNLLINALKQQGTVLNVTQPSVATLNMQPVPVQVARQTGYLAQVQTSAVAQVGATTSLVPGMVTDGFNMTVLPSILPDGKTLLVQFSMNLATLDGFQTESSGGSSIKVPQLENKATSQRVKLTSGSTLILSGFQQTTNNDTQQGVGSSRFWLLGGGRNRDDARQVMVVLITPVITG